MATIASSLGGAMFSAPSAIFIRVMTFIEGLPVVMDSASRTPERCPGRQPQQNKFASRLSRLSVTTVADRPSNKMLDPAHIDVAMSAARPKAIGALLRYFRNLDTAEEAFQEACLRALQAWPQKGFPADPTAWLVTVGRNAALDIKRRNRPL